MEDKTGKGNDEQTNEGWFNCPKSMTDWRCIDFCLSLHVFLTLAQSANTVCARFPPMELRLAECC